MKTSVQPDLWQLYRQMLKSRLFEQAVIQLWEQGLISGEMHLGIGEEAIVAGVLDHLQDGDALALDHRGTPPLLMRGIDPVLLMREFLGRPDGLCAGVGGHMHLFSPQHLAASSGIVGASGPTAAGFALAGHMLRPGSVAVAFLGEGAMNQGMMMEAMHLAAVWRLPTLFVCKDDGWAISTQSPKLTAGDITDRARSLGLHATNTDGSDVQAVWHTVREVMTQVRENGAPAFIRARCTHSEGHLLGLLLIRVARDFVREMAPMTGPLLRSTLRIRGAPIKERAAGLAIVLSTLRQFIRRHTGPFDDPVQQARARLAADGPRLKALEAEIEQDTLDTVEAALAAPACDEKSER
jgi:pyruvate dehydrogenase E1 component alpha subunit